LATAVIAAAWIVTGALLMRIAAAKMLDGVAHAFRAHPLEAVAGGLVGVASMILAAWLLVGSNRSRFAVSAFVGGLVVVDCTALLFAGHESAALAIVVVAVAAGLSAVAWRSWAA
jgi:hypothetical protein